MVYPLGRPMTCTAPVFFNGGDTETNEQQSQNKRSLASSPIIQLNASRHWISGSSCGVFNAVGKFTHLLRSEAKFVRRLGKNGQLLFNWWTSNELYLEYLKNEINYVFLNSIGYFNGNNNNQKVKNLNSSPWYIKLTHLRFLFSFLQLY